MASLFQTKTSASSKETFGSNQKICALISRPITSYSWSMPSEIQPELPSLEGAFHFQLPTGKLAMQSQPMFTECVQTTCALSTLEVILVSAFHG